MSKIDDIVETHQPFLGFGATASKYESENHEAICMTYASPQDVLDIIEAVGNDKIIGITESRRDDYTKERTCVYYKK